MTHADRVRAAERYLVNAVMDKFLAGSFEFADAVRPFANDLCNLRAETCPTCKGDGMLPGHRRTRTSARRLRQRAREGGQVTDRELLEKADHPVPAGTFLYVPESVALAAMQAARADERERCAKVCEEQVPPRTYEHDPIGTDAYNHAADECAAAIRALGKE